MKKMAWHQIQKNHLNFRISFSLIPTTSLRVFLAGFVCVFLMDLDYNLQFGGLLLFNCYYSAYCFSLFAWLGLFLRLNRTSELHYFRIQAVALFFSRTMMMMLISPSNQKHYCKWKLFSFLTFAVIRFCAHFIEIMMRIFWWLYRIE